jgi:hypothetical protein
MMLGARLIVLTIENIHRTMAQHDFCLGWLEI